jgi:hypothetical protein
VPEGALVARGGVVVEVEDWWGGAGWIAVFAPGHGAAIWESEWLCWGWHTKAFDILPPQLIPRECGERIVLNTNENAK